MDTRWAADQRIPRDTRALRDLMETHSYQNCGSYSVIAPSNASAQLKAPNETLTAKSRFGKTARVRSSTSDALANHRDIASRNSSARSTPCACSATASPAWPLRCSIAMENGGVMRALTQRLYSLRDSTLGSPDATELAQHPG